MRKDLQSFSMASHASTRSSLEDPEELDGHLLSVASQADESHESTAEQNAADFFTTEEASLAISDLQAFLQDNSLAFA